MADLHAAILGLNQQFLDLHSEKENLFWETKMGLGDNAIESQKKLSKAEIAMQEWSQDANRLQALKSFDQSNGYSQDDKTALSGWINYFTANTIEQKSAQQISLEVIELEGALQSARNAMDLGYIDPKTGAHVPATSTLLANIMKMDDDEATRKAAFEGMRSIEPYVIEHGFLEIVKKRNALGRALGYEDYYDMKVQRTEGFSKKRLFELLDDLEAKTRDAAKLASENFAKEKGETALEAWNYGYMRSGDLPKLTDPYFSFTHSLDRWVRSFSAMNIRYRGATLQLDLIDRKGKYENGFMHGPVPAYFNEGKWMPAHINFTANAMPNKVGAGFRAMETLFHEGGHAAHFSNVLMNSPCFSNEFAPTSVAYAETQSMFLDSILSDADWQTRYAKNDKDEAIPFELIERSIRLEQPFEPLMIRSMLTICYVEKYLYEMSDDQLTRDNVLSMMRDVERKMQFLNAGPRPALAVSHLLAGESSAYYHGYVLAEMAVQQTREYFMAKYGHIMDNPNIGPELEAGYWAPGNSVAFMDLVEKLTGKPFSADALVRSATRTPDQAVHQAEKLVEHLHNVPEYKGPFELDAKIRVVHGREEITHFTDGHFERADREFIDWVESHYPPETAN